jgi:hypothetical protein
MKFREHLNKSESINEAVSLEVTLGKVLDKYTSTYFGDEYEVFGVFYNYDPADMQRLLDDIGSYRGPDENEEVAQTSGGEFDEWPDVTWGEIKNITIKEYKSYVKKTDGKYPPEKIAAIKKAIQSVI